MARKLLRNTLLAGALALGLSTAAKADESSNFNKLPVTCPAISEREIIRHEVLADNSENVYTTYLGGNAANLTVVRTEDPLQRIGTEYRAPIGDKDLIEIVTENKTDLRFRNGLSRTKTAPQLISAGADNLIYTEDLPSDFQEGTLNYWTQARRYNPRTFNEENCASVSFPIHVYRAPTPVAQPAPAEQPLNVRMREILDTSCATPCVSAPQCSDGVDNDSDGKIDFPADPGCRSPRDDNERRWRENKRDRNPSVDLPAKNEFNVTLRKGVSQYTFADTQGNEYQPLDFDINQVAMRYRYLGNKAKVDLQGAMTNGTDKTDLKLSAFDAEIHADYKLWDSNVALGLSGAAGYKDVRTYWDFLPGWNVEDTRQANGYGYAGVNLSITGDGGFASNNWLVLRAGVVAQPIVDKQMTFGDRTYDSTTDMEIAMPEFSLDVRKSFSERTWLDLQARFSPKVETAYTSPNVTRELTKVSDYKNLTLGFGHMFGDEMKHGIYGQFKWADNKEEWQDFVDNLGRPFSATGRHEGLTVGLGYTYRFGK